MPHHEITRTVSSRLAVKTLHVLLIGSAWTRTDCLTAQNVPYSIERLQVNGTLEYRFKSDSHHFMTLVNEQGTFNLRPHPGCDVNGWGSSWYAQPFFPAAVLKHSVIDNAHADAHGIHLTVSGKVSHSAESSFGTWGITMHHRYDPVGKKVAGTGVYTIRLAGPLSDSTGDLNLYKIASNYLNDVPLFAGNIGDTGDMKAARVIGDGFSFTWVPPDQPSFFPDEKSDVLAIEVVGDYNTVDTGAMGYARTDPKFKPIAPAYKPSLNITLRSRRADVGIAFGAVYDLSKGQQYWEDNVGITPLIRRTSPITEFAFDLSFESTSLDRGQCSPV